VLGCLADWPSEICALLHSPNRKNRRSHASTHMMEPQHRRCSSDPSAVRRSSSPRSRSSPYDKPHDKPSPLRPSPMAEEPAPTFDCAICQTPMTDPAVGGGCAHHFCFECYEQWTAKKATCPTCRAPVWKIVVDTEIASQHGIELSARYSTQARNSSSPAPTNPAVTPAQHSNGGMRTVQVDGPAGLTLANTHDGKGCLVVRVVKGNGAHRAGIRAQDVLFKVNGADVHDHSVAVEFIERRCRVGDCEITYRSMVDVFFSGAATMLRTIRPRVAAPAAFALRHRVRRSSPLIQPTQLPSDVEDSPGFPFRPTEAMAPPPAAVA